MRNITLLAALIAATPALAGSLPAPNFVTPATPDSSTAAATTAFVQSVIKGTPAASGTTPGAGAVGRAWISPTLNGASMTPWSMQASDKASRIVTPQDFGAECGGSFVPVNTVTNSPYDVGTPLGGTTSNYASSTAAYKSFPDLHNAAATAAGATFSLNPQHSVDQAGFQDAIDWLAQNGGGRVYVPAGSSCVLDGPLYALSDVSIFGAGGRASKISFVPRAGTPPAATVSYDNIQVLGNRVEVTGIDLNGGAPWLPANNGAIDGTDPFNASIVATQASTTDYLQFPPASTIWLGMPISGPGIPPGVIGAPLTYYVLCTPASGTSGICAATTTMPVQISATVGGAAVPTTVPALSGAQYFINGGAFYGLDSIPAVVTSQDNAITATGASTTASVTGTATVIPVSSTAGWTVGMVIATASGPTPNRQVWVQSIGSGVLNLNQAIGVNIASGIGLTGTSGTVTLPAGAFTYVAPDGFSKPLKNGQAIWAAIPNSGQSYFASIAEVGCVEPGTGNLCAGPHVNITDVNGNVLMPGVASVNGGTPTLLPAGTQVYMAGSLPTNAGNGIIVSGDSDSIHDNIVEGVSVAGINNSGASNFRTANNKISYTYFPGIQNLYNTNSAGLPVLTHDGSILDNTLKFSAWYNHIRANGPFQPATTAYVRGGVGATAVVDPAGYDGIGVNSGHYNIIVRGNHLINSVDIIDSDDCSLPYSLLGLTCGPGLPAEATGPVHHDLIEGNTINTAGNGITVGHNDRFVDILNNVIQGTQAGGGLNSSKTNACISLFVADPQAHIRVAGNSCKGTQADNAISLVGFGTGGDVTIGPGNDLENNGAGDGADIVVSTMAGSVRIFGNVATHTESPPNMLYAIDTSAAGVPVYMANNVTSPGSSGKAYNNQATDTIFQPTGYGAVANRPAAGTLGSSWFDPATGQTSYDSGTAWTVSGGGYTLPATTTSTLGGMIVGTGLRVASGTVSTAYGTGTGTSLQGSLLGASGGVASLTGTVLTTAQFPGVSGGGISCPAGSITTCAVTTQTTGDTSADAATDAFVANTLAAPPAIGGTTAGAAQFTTIHATGVATLSGGVALSGRTVTASSAVTVLTTDNVVVINKTTGAATAVSLPAGPSNWRMFIIKDGKGDAATNNITVTPGAGTISGAGTDVINTAYGFRIYLFDGTNYDIVSKG